MKHLFCFALIAALLGVAPIATLAQSSFTLDQALSRIDESSKTFRSVESNIERTKVTVIIDDKDVQSGKFYYTKRGADPRVKLEITKPAEEYALVDNGKAQLYIPKLKQVQEVDLSKNKETVEMFLALGFGTSSQDLKKSFDISVAPDEVVDGQKRTVIDLKPKTQSMFQSIRMWLDQKAWHAVQIKTVEKTNDYLIVKFTNIKLNAGLPDSRFKLNLPKDVKVIR